MKLLIKIACPYSQGRFYPSLEALFVYSRTDFSCAFFSKGEKCKMHGYRLWSKVLVFTCRKATNAARDFAAVKTSKLFSLKTACLFSNKLVPQNNNHRSFSLMPLATRLAYQLLESWLLRKVQINPFIGRNPVHVKSSTVAANI